MRFIPPHKTKNSKKDSTQTNPNSPFATPAYHQISWQVKLILSLQILLLTVFQATPANAKDNPNIAPLTQNNSAETPYPQTIAQPEANIAIDVGHSKQSQGAISSRGIAEYEFNLSLARRIQTALAPENDPRAFLIYSEPDISLTKRTRIAARKNATFFLSVHHDSAVAAYLDSWQWKGKTYYHTHKYSGFGLFVSRKNAYLEQSLKCASAIGAALQGEGFHYSDHHSAHIAGENREWADKANGVYYYDDLVVLKTAKTPAVLFEAGVIVNPNEEQWLQRSKTKDKMAAAVKAGLTRCGVYY